MRPPAFVHDALARLLEYPSEGFEEGVQEWSSQVAGACPGAEGPLDRFAKFAVGPDTGTLQEFFTRTFEINPACTLEVGWQLFGENYNRGEFLVRMRQILKNAGVPETSELPDHLTQVLRALGRMEPRQAAALADESAIPAVKKMAVNLAVNENPYEGVLDAVLEVLAMHRAPEGVQE
ncbi:MAG: nitrate reductase molybdenum cofactor assembly chaperone [Planctomycetota bacterium]